MFVAVWFTGTRGPAPTLRSGLQALDTSAAVFRGTVVIIVTDE
jgi:hypothetical protein